MANPLLSVIIPVHNAARFLPDAVASVRRQCYAPLEILIVDDGSEDDCARVAAELGEPVRYIRQEQAGPAAARNHGLELARGEFIGLLDADDLWPDQKLSIQMSRLLAEPDLDLVLGRVSYVALEGGEIPDFNFEGPDHEITNVHLGAGLYRRRAFEKVGHFDAGLRYGEDVDWFLRVREMRLNMRILRPVTLIYRLHDTNMTRAREDVDRHLAFALKRSIDRRRRMGADGRVPLARWFSYDEWWQGTPPLVSVIVPVFNGAQYVGEAVNSILTQSYRPMEAIVVDDGSTDETARVLDEFGPRIRRAAQAHAGQSAARNLGVDLATGRYLAFLDADDVWPEEKLAAQVAILEEDPQCDLLFGHVEQFRQHGGAGSGPMPGHLPGTLLVRRDTWLKVGPLRSDVKVGEFLDWLARSREQGLRERMDGRVWLRRRIHGDNLGVRERDARGDYVRLLKDAMDRRRRAGGEGAPCTVPHLDGQY
jgi:glycosyltransferase involved in cell wall biosynthesis